MSEMSKELKLWAKDDIVPSDLQALCRKVADCHNKLVGACRDFVNLAAVGMTIILLNDTADNIKNKKEAAPFRASAILLDSLQKQTKAALKAAGVE